MTKIQPTDRGRSFVYDTIAEAAVTHISYVNKAKRLCKQKTPWQKCNQLNVGVFLAR